MDNEYVSPAVIVVTLSFFLTVLEPCNYDKDLATKVWVRFVIFIHHTLKIMWFYIPLLYGNRFPNTMLYIIIFGVTYLLIQNTLLFDESVTQTCILSQYTNNVCMISPNSDFRDFVYYLGFKQNTHTYNFMYNVYCVLYIVFLITLILK